MAIPETDPFAGPEGLSSSEPGFWPSCADELLDCGHDVVYGDQIGYLSAGRGCEDCVRQEWEDIEECLRHTTPGYWDI